MTKRANEIFTNLPDISHIEDYFIYLESLVKTEEEIEKKDFESSIKNASKKSKRQDGILWPSVTLTDVEFHDPSKIILFISRKQDAIPPQFQEGQNIRLYKDSTDKTEEIYGLLKYVSNETATIIIHGEDLPDFIENGNFSMEISYSDITFKAMYHSLNSFKLANDKLIQKYKSALFNNDSSEEANKVKNSILNLFLNQSQNQALNGILNSRDIFVVQGPPGTGKTTVIIESVKELVKLNEKILLCAPGNFATDLLVEKSIESNLNVLRLGNPVRISEKLYDSTLENKILTHPLYKDIKSYKKQAGELFRQAKTFKRNMNKTIYEERKQKLKESKELHKLAKKTEEIIIKDILDKSNIFACTLTHLYLNKNFSYLDFDTIIIDEASQALEPLLYLCFILKPKSRVIIVGDPNQLPPFTVSHHINSGLKITLIEKLLNKYINNPSKFCMLQTQYRMNDQIFGFTNSEFYKGILHSNQTNLSHTLEFDKIKENVHLLFIDTAGTDFSEENSDSSSSIFNRGEAELILTILKKYYSKSIEVNKLSTFGVLSPYKAQVYLLKELATDMEIENSNIEINTIDSFQGRECDCIFLSLCRSNPNKEIGFLEDHHRLNVALSRAKKELIVFGDSETVSKSSHIKNLIQYAKKIDGYSSAWEFIEL